MLATQDLYDQGEENWPVRIHAGCGGIYLRGYTNVDGAGELAEDNPAQAMANMTDIRDYYARLHGSLETLPIRRPTVVDVRADLLNYTDSPPAWNKVIALQVLEHFTPLMGLRLLTMWREKLEVNHGVCVISVPDMLDTVDLITLDPYYRKEVTFAIRHLLGSGRDIFNHHKAWYTPASLAESLWAAGFTSISVLPNFHLYPALVMRAWA